MAETSTYKSATNGNTETALGRDVSSVIWHTSEPRNCPINTLLGGDLYLDGKSEPQKVPGIIKKEKATEYKYELLQKSSLGRAWKINGAIASASTTTLVFDSTAGMQAGMILRFQSKDAPEIISIDSVTNGTTIEAKRNIGATTYQILDDADIVAVGWAQKEGGSKRAIRAQLASATTRYLQIFKNTFGITDTLLNSDLVVEKDAWSEEMKQAAQQHQFDKEYSFWFNPAADSTTDASSNTSYLTRGLLAELGSTYTTDCGGKMDEADFMGFVSEDAFAYGPDTKLLMADSKFLSRINAFASLKQQMKSEETKYGLGITTVITIHGIYKIMHCGVFNKFLTSDEAGYAVVLDPDRIVYKYLKNMDSKYEEGIQTPGDSVKEAQFVSQVGLSLRSLNHHRIIKNIG